MTRFAERIGLAIAAARRRKALTQQDLADQAGINLRSLTRIEKGEAAPALATFAKLAAVLDLDTNAVLHIQPQPRGISSLRRRSEERLQSVVQQLSDQRVDDLVKIAESLK